MATVKTYSYKVYNIAGVYVGNWDPDVVSEFSVAEEINSSGSQLTVKLARPADNFGEGTDVEFNYKVMVYAIDGEQPNGVLVFQGYIANYTPVYGADEHVDIVVLGYGNELDGYVIGADEVVDQSQTTTNSSEDFGPGRMIAQGFVPSVSPITSIDLKLKVTSAPTVVTIGIYPTSSGGDYPDTTPVTGATASLQVVDTTEQLLKFTFGSPISIVTGVKYWIVISA